MRTAYLLTLGAWLGPFFALLFCLVAPGINGPMYLDSGHIGANAHIFEQAGLAGVVEMFPQRPIPMASFFFNYCLGGMDPSSFRIVNLLLHSIAATLVVLLMRIVLELTDPAGGLGVADKYVLSLFMGVFFLIHPLQIFATLYIWQRMAILAYMFYLASLLCYLFVRMGYAATWSGYLLSCVFFLLALLSKENAVTLVLALLFFEACFFSKDWKSLAGRSVVLTAILLVIVSLVSLLQHAHGMSAFSSGLLATVKQYYKESGLSLGEVFLTQCRVILQYLSMVILPVPSSVHLVMPQVISSSLVSPPATLPAVTAIAGLILLGIRLLFVRPLIGMGILVFIVNMAPDSFLVPQFAFFGYRPLFGMVGVCFVAIDCLALVLHRVRNAVIGKYVRIGLIILGLGYAIFLGVVTREVASIWDNQSLFWKRAVEAFPSGKLRWEKGTASLILFDLGTRLKDEGRMAEALDYMNRSRKMRPGHPVILTGLASLSRRMGKISEAEMYLERAIRCPVPYPNAYRDLGLVKLDLGKIDEAIRCLEKAQTLAPRDPITVNALQTVRNRKEGSRRVKP